LPLSTSVMEKLKHKESLMTFNDDPGAKKRCRFRKFRSQTSAQNRGTKCLFYGESDFHF
jgi:hypothetical protein